MRQNKLKPKTFEDGCEEVVTMLIELLVKKQADYGKENILAFGELGCLVRANDKIARLKHLFLSHKMPKNETIEDSWQDLANYAIIALLLKRGYFNLPLSGKELGKGA